MRLGIGVDEIDELVKLSDLVQRELVAPPSVTSPGVCPRCRTWKPNDSVDEDCANCIESRAVLGADPLRISVASLYAKPSQLRDWLTRYKGRGDGLDDFDQGSADIVRALAARYILEHGQRLAEICGGFDALAVVPSTHREPPHPFERILDSLEVDVPVRALLERGPGDLGFRKPALDGYCAVSGHEPARVLLLDDVYTTGSRINSAAAALRAAGYTVAGALVLARRVNPDYTPEARSFWDNAANEVFGWADGPVCCRA